MRQCIILASHLTTERALRHWADALPKELLELHVPQGTASLRSISNEQQLREVYWDLVESLESLVRSDAPLAPGVPVTVIVDHIRPARLSVMSGDPGNSTLDSYWHALVAMLILSFPEVCWVFGAVTWDEMPSDEGKALFAVNCGFGALLEAVQVQHFDPYGLRNWVRRQTNAHLGELRDHWLPLRSKAAAVIEDDAQFALLHAYTTYRFGLRASVFNSWESLVRRFGPAVQHGYWLLLEDMSLKYPGRPRESHLTDLEERGNSLRALDSGEPRFECSEHRILVTSGQAAAGDGTLARNRIYLRAKVRGRGLVVFKPASGMFDLWRKAGLSSGIRSKPGFADMSWGSYLAWEPDSNVVASNHGVDGRVSLVAERLLQRASALSGQASQMRSYVLGAILATDALEITGGMAATLATEALSLKQKFEVLSECEFSGVEYHIAVVQRIREVASYAKWIGLSYSRRQREAAEQNIQMHILNQLVRILRDHNQFDEEQVCMRRVRNLHHSLWMRQHRKRGGQLMWPILRYLELLLSSFGTFVLTIFVWIILLSLLFFWSSGLPTGTGEICGLQDAISTFFSVGPPTHPEEICVVGKRNWAYAATSSFGIVGGALHLGVFVSYLYSMLSRR